MESTKELKSRGGRRMAATPGPDDWSAWTDHLRERTSPMPAAELARQGSTNIWGSLDWGWPATENRPGRDLRELSLRGRIDDKNTVRELESWLQRAHQQGPDPDFAREAVAWARLLPRLAGPLPNAPWSQLLETLLLLVRDAAALDVDETLLERQLLAGELAVTLAYELPELPACRTLWEPAGRLLSRDAMDLLDGEGLPHGRHLPQARRLLACWIRCRLMEKAAGRKLWKKSAWEQVEWLLRQCLRLTRSDATQILGPASPWESDFLQTALVLAGDEDDTDAARALRLVPADKKGKKPPAEEPAADPDVYSEWSEAAVMRTEWKPNAPYFAVTFYGSRLQAELGSHRHCLFSGDVTPALQVDGVSLEISREWEEICWFSDDEVQYLELEAEFGRNWRIQRQMLLAREDRLFLLADAVLGRRASGVEYSLSLPLTSTDWSEEEETREGMLTRDRPLALVVPLGLPEWRVSPADGTLASEDGLLTYRCRARGQALMAPLLFDLKSKRLKRARTWRHLTVAENLEVQPPEMAVGYRYQNGPEHWLLYRALLRKGNRTVLGQNYSEEFAFGRFHRDGTVDALLEIE